MKIAVVGSRSLNVVNLKDYLPPCDEIVSGGAKGVDTCAAKYAQAEGIRLKVFLPDYRHYKKGAPIVRNRQIVEYADQVFVFWDGVSKGSLRVLHLAQALKKPYTLVLLPPSQNPV